ncbi:DUF221-domain-containing protein [Amylocystis lapponica]|nr:DUF221-domain-containing protein [Amylocystis lapponica]
MQRHPVVHSDQSFDVPFSAVQRNVHPYLIFSHRSGISDAQSSTTSTFVTALVFNAAVFGIELAVFTVVRPYFPAIYQPRTYVPPEARRIKPLSQNIFLWPWAVFNANYRDIKDANGLDAYFFVRFLRMIARYLLPVWIVSWIVLLPVTSVGTGTPGLNQFNFGNVGTGNTPRYAAHLILAYIFTFWMFWNIRIEMNHFVSVRQRWLISPANTSHAQANTILVTGVPQRYLTEAALTNLFSHLPGGVRKVWLNRDLKEMPELYDRRMAACQKLESAETGLMNTAAKLRRKQAKKDAKAAKKNGHVSSDTVDGMPLRAGSIADTERGDVALVPANKRPTHRLPLSFMPFALPFIGKEVDSIEWARDEIETTNAGLREARRTLARDVARTSAETPPEVKEGDGEGDSDMKPDADSTQTYPPMNSAFVLFNRQIAAHLAAQSLTHHGPYRMAQKSIGVAPQDIIWSNLNMNPYEARVRVAISWAFTLGLIILWAFPVAFIGAVSNIHSLCSTYSWLAWICKLPSVVVGIITGILPPVLLAVLMMLLPIILRLLSRFEGTPQRTAVERSLMSRYFLFLVIHSFLIVTLSSGIIAALPQLVSNPSGIPALLANNLPKASTFFLTYIILQGLSGTAGGFLQVVALVLYYLRSVSWGTLFPSTTLLVVITIAYSIISPVINGLAFVAFFLFYQVWKYLFLWQLEQPRSGETGGMFFPTAISMSLSGFCRRPEGALMIVLIVLTAFYHMLINNSYDPIMEYLPLSLASKSSSLPEDENRSAAGAQLADNASVHSADAHGEKARARGDTLDSRGSKGRAHTVEDAERGGGAAGDSDESERGVDEDAGPKDFYHPASVEPQRMVWIPRDGLGLGQAEEAAIRERGILVSTAGARMDAQGHVDIEGAPPDEKEIL